jgi:hypothetical protein
VRPAEFPAAKSRLLRYQLYVIAADVADVLQSVGGWLFDRSMAGWDVNVLLAKDHIRPVASAIFGDPNLVSAPGWSRSLRWPSSATYRHWPMST